MKFLFDFFPILLFFVAYKLYDIFVATGVAMVAALVQTLTYYFKHGRFEKMHLVTLGLLLVFGGLTLVLHDPVFIKWKPTVINWLFGVVFAGSAWIGRKTLVQRMMDHAVPIEDPAIWSRLNWAWVTFFLAMGALNLYVAFNFDEETWVNFKLFGLMGLTFVFVFGQALYLSRHLPAEDAKEGGD
jgi:intracellular septation protein